MSPPPEHRGGLVGHRVLFLCLQERLGVAAWLGAVTAVDAGCRFPGHLRCSSHPTQSPRAGQAGMRAGCAAQKPDVCMQ